MSRPLQQTRSDPKLWVGHVPSVLQGVRQGHWFQEARLNLRHTSERHTIDPLLCQSKNKLFFKCLDVTNILRGK